MSEPVPLTNNQRRALAAILAHPTLNDAARACGLSTKTLGRYLRNNRFRAALAASESDTIDQATRRLLQLTDLAVDTLQRILTSKTAREGSQLRAAQLVVDSLIRLRELVNERRISDLEKAVYGGTKHK